jgi:Ca2+-binding EF-hand superfamily protein
MRHTICVLCVTLGSALSLAGEEQDRFEDQATIRCAHHKAERSLRAERGERANTIRDLDAVFPGKLTKTEPGKTEDEGEVWYKLLAGTGDEWRKSDAVAAGLGPMFERWKQRLELGPVPSIKHDEFIKFSKLIIRNAAAAQGEGGEINTNDEADKVFRILDLNSDGELTANEQSAGMREDKSLGARVTKEEYREYFRRRVEKKAETLATALKANETLMRTLESDKPDKHSGLPDWFTKLDTNKDKQISLSEWRKSGRPIAEFQEMDLNGDGLLTADEYLRWVKQKIAEKEKEEP